MTLTYCNFPKRLWFQIIEISQKQLSIGQPGKDYPKYQGKYHETFAPFKSSYIHSMKGDHMNVPIWNKQLLSLTIIFSLALACGQAKADSYVTCSTKFDLIGESSLTHSAKIAKKFKATYESVLDGEKYIADISYSARLVQKKSESNGRFLRRRLIVQDLMKKKIKVLKKAIGTGAEVIFDKNAPICTASS